MTNQEAINVLFNEWKCIDRNDGIHCDRKCETCDLVMDVEIIREAYNMAISALQAQEAKTQLSAEGTTSDLISRQAAINTVKKHYRVDNDLLEVIVYQLENLPSAQPEPSIPISWIEKQIDWLKSMDNEFANLTAMNISTMVKKWKKEQEETDGSDK